MVRYLQPDQPPFGYLPSGEILTLSDGDFFKCAHCRRFQRHVGQLYALGEPAKTLQLCCVACHHSGLSCQAWPSGMQKTG
ncbi:MAG: hypothetical protein CVV27_01325 [Candidatus Melainabacteria bacterium HGW-Melainabacteria-1]|nr:MAG: hypothetical protein CVV27_01325 [Candidatus Melainabacteria bacterium HGW-Melainabacteria-1]